MDEVDYMGDTDFDTVMTIAAERNDIGMKKYYVVNQRMLQLRCIQ